MPVDSMPGHEPTPFVWVESQKTQWCFGSAQRKPSSLLVRGFLCFGGPFGRPAAWWSRAVAIVRLLSELLEPTCRLGSAGPEKGRAAARANQHEHPSDGDSQESRELIDRRSGDQSTGIEGVLKRVAEGIDDTLLVAIGRFLARLGIGREFHGCVAGKAPETRGGHLFAATKVVEHGFDLLQGRLGGLHCTEVLGDDALVVPEHRLFVEPLFAFELRVEAVRVDPHGLS